MRTNTKYLLYFSFIFTLISCEQPKSRNDSIDFSNINSEHILNLSSLYDSIKYVKLETSSNSLIGSIKKVIPFNKQFFIFDEEYSNIFIFDDEGKFIKKIGNQGTGPNEYVKYEDICFDTKSNRLFALDNTRNRIQTFDKNGNFLYNIELKFFTGEIKYLSEDIIVCYNDFKMNHNLKKGNKNPLVTLINANNGEILSNEIYISSKIESEEVISPYFATSTNGSEVILFDILKSTIYVYDEKHNRKEYVLNFGAEDTRKRKIYYSKLQDKDLDVYDVCIGCEEEPNFVMITSAFKESDNLFVFATDYTRKVQYFIKYNLLSNHYIYTKTSKFSPFINDIDNGISILLPNTIENNKVYGCINASIFEYIDKSKITNGNLLSIMNNTNEEDNPILFIATLKK